MLWYNSLLVLPEETERFQVCRHFSKIYREAYSLACQYKRVGYLFIFLSLSHFCNLFLLAIGVVCMHMWVFCLCDCLFACLLVFLSNSLPLSLLLCLPSQCEVAQAPPLYLQILKTYIWKVGAFHIGYQKPPCLRQRS